MADHQLNKVEAVPTEKVEGLPEAIIVPVRVTVYTEYDSTELENSFQPRARTHDVFWAGAVRGVGDVCDSFSRGDNVTGVEMQV